MKVSMKTLSAGPAGIRQPGTVVEVDDAEGKALVAGGYADAIDTPKKGKKLKPDEPKAEESKPDENVGDDSTTTDEGGDA